MDLGALNARGVQPLQQWFDQIGAINNMTDLMTVVGSLHKSKETPLFFYVSAIYTHVIDTPSHTRH